MKLYQTKFLTFICFSIAPFFLLAQWDKSLVPFEQNGLWGYMNSEKAIVVEAKFAEAYPLFYGRGRIKHKGKYGFVNRIGEIEIKARYKEAEDFSLNGAAVIKSKKKFRIDTLGKVNSSWIMTCGYEPECNNLIPLHPHQLIEKDNLYGVQIQKEVTQSDGQINIIWDTLKIEYDSIFPLHLGMIGFKKNGKFGFISKSRLPLGAKKTNEMLDLKFEDFIVFPCYESSTELKSIMALKKNGKWGLVYLSYKGWSDGKGSGENIECKYNSIVSLGKNYLIVEYKPNKLGFVDFMNNEYFIDD